MSSQNPKIGIGEILVFTSGEYSDYMINGYAVALSNFDLHEAEVEFMANYDSKDAYFKIFSDFVSWLVVKEKIIPVAHREIYLGSYGKFEEEDE